MDDDQQLHDLLVRAAELAGDRPSPPTDLFLRARRRRARRRSLSLAGAAAVVALAAIVPAVTFAGGPHRETSQRSSGITATSPSTPGVVDAPGRQISGPATAAALATDRWTQLPAAPIAGRGDAAAVWDGQQMLVWGGEAGSRLFADGAGYDPARRIWMVLPQSPLSARTATAHVWTGRFLFVWGGLDSTAGSGHYADDGALYDPRTRTWRMLPPAPVPVTDGAQALLVGNAVVVLPGRAPDGTQPTAAAAYDPTSNTWRRVASLPLPSRGRLTEVTATATGDGIALWEQWENTTPISSNSSSSFSGLAMFRYDNATDRWHAEQTTGDGPPYVVPQALWTGRQLLVPATEQCPVGAFCPAMTNRNGYALSPSERWTPIPHGPVDDLDPQSLWTGSALLDYNASTLIGSSGPGEAAAWDPTSGAWTQLPAAPYAGLGAASVWTGSRLLLWGPMFRADQLTGASAPTPVTVGLELGP